MSFCYIWWYKKGRKERIVSEQKTMIAVVLVQLSANEEDVSLVSNSQDQILKLMVANLSKITSLDLSYNNFVGHIPCSN